MAENLDALLAKRPVDRASVEAHKQRMLAEVRAYPFGHFGGKPD